MWRIKSRGGVSATVLIALFLFVFVLFFLFFFEKMSRFEKNERFFAVSNAAVYSLLVLCMSCSESLLEKKKKSEQNLFWGSDSWQLKIEEKERPQSNLYSVCINLFTPKISSVILLTICHAILMILVWRILGIGSTKNPLIAIFLYSHHFSAKYWIENVRRNSLLVTHGSESVKRRKSCTWKWSNDKFQLKWFLTYLFCIKIKL